MQKARQGLPSPFYQNYQVRINYMLSFPEKVQSMSLISIFHRLDAYNAQSSHFGGSGENEDSI